MEDVRNGKIQGAVIIPPQFSRACTSRIIRDRPDRRQQRQLHEFHAGSRNSPTHECAEPADRRAAPPAENRSGFVELYPYIEYMKYLLPGSITLAMFVSVMIGGGMLYIDDKARGVHEGYLVTPITKTELVFGLNLAGAIKAVLTGVIITVIGSLLAGVGTIFNPVDHRWLADHDPADSWPSTP